MKTGRHAIECILPPHILENIVENGTPDQRGKAIQTLQVTSQLLNERKAAQEAGGAPPAGASPAPGVKQRLVYSANNQTGLPGQPVRREGDPPSGDPAVDEAYDGAGITYDLYWNAYQRNSIDGDGLRLDSTVHYDVGYDNAFWNGQQMVYGDGDEDLPPADRLFNRFTIALDVIAHELTHGVVQYTANLEYNAQSGALNESFSDVFGSLARQYRLQQTAAQADWIIGAGLFTGNVHGVGIRSMKAPGSAYDDPVLGKDPQPAHMRDYVNTPADNGGVHINSGIPNHAFYRTALEMGGFAWEKAGLIWYAALRDRIRPTSNFQDAANLTYAVAGELFGPNSPEQQAVSLGWNGVGIPVAAPAEPAGCLAGLRKALGLD